MDCSIPLSSYFSDEGKDSTHALRERLIEANMHIPSLWPLEVINAVLAALRRKRVTEVELPALLADLRQLPDEIDRETDSMVWDDSFYLTKRFGLPVCDARHLELAMRKELPIATLDKALANASIKAGVNVLL